jgi:transposase InsO family protein
MDGRLSRCAGTVLEEFFRPTMRSRLYQSIEPLQADFDAWLRHYNHERPHLGYGNQGPSAIGTPWSASSAKSPAIQGG